MKIYALILSVLVLTACQEEIVAPDPVALTREAEGFYCNMIVIDHPGPKAQVFEKNRDRAIWFTSVRDALAYNILPGEAQHVLAIYVHDMGRADSWDRPNDDGIWMKASAAYYVIDSNRRGGMGARETIPFGDPRKAEAFTVEHGGRVVAFNDIPTDYLLGDSGEYGSNSGE
ncbi:nitrous oxide reductase accessory protein NosL [Paremcibacter congregatus]|uniref:Copper resistance protein CopZ n=1 Tax=Paremcibacter congregatus TaxID=2043170 RepID=A0A2G4YPT8_9PROT|nr:nitrous oxide reductase accessory protein NosL [Paremcibacter congregatus]PHZ84328.1 copper resistance protein CopZ [Paremcibacter congregatus]QDE28548.1 copper resistance protein CopZ [Paremcibacter congregatus]